MEQHTFEAEGGLLVHRMDGAIRAVVPPEGFADYLAQWPDAQPIVDAITGPRPAPKPEPTPE